METVTDTKTLPNDTSYHGDCGAGDDLDLYGDIGTETGIKNSLPQGAEDDRASSDTDLYWGLTEDSDKKTEENTTIADSTGTDMDSELLSKDGDQKEDRDGTCDDLDLYDDIITEDDNIQKQTYSEMLEKFESAMKKINRLKQENESLRSSVEKLSVTSESAQKNVSSVLMTARAEVKRKDAEIRNLRKQLSGIGQKQRPVGGLRGNTLAQRNRNDGTIKRDSDTDNRRENLHHRLRDSDYSDSGKQDSDFDTRKRDKCLNRRDRDQQYRKNDSDFDKKRNKVSDRKGLRDTGYRKNDSDFEKRDSDYNEGKNKKASYEKDKKSFNRKDEFDSEKSDRNLRRGEEEKSNKREKQTEKSNKREKETDFGNKTKYKEKRDGDFEQDSVLNDKDKKSKQKNKDVEKERPYRDIETRLKYIKDSSLKNRNKNLDSKNKDSVKHLDRYTSSSSKSVRDSSKIDRQESTSNRLRARTTWTNDKEKELEQISCLKTTEIKSTDDLIAEVDTVPDIVNKKNTRTPPESKEKVQRQSQPRDTEKSSKNTESTREITTDVDLSEGHTTSKLIGKTEREEKSENKNAVNFIRNITESTNQTNNRRGFDLRQKLKAKKEDHSKPVNKGQKQENSPNDDEDELPVNNSNYVLSENLFTKRSRSKVNKLKQSQGVDDIEKDRLFLAQLKQSTESKLQSKVFKQCEKKSSVELPVDNRKVVDYSDTNCFGTDEKEYYKNDSSEKTFNDKFSNKKIEITSIENASVSPRQLEKTNEKQNGECEKLKDNCDITNKNHTKTLNNSNLSEVETNGNMPFVSTSLGKDDDLKEGQEAHGRKKRKQSVEGNGQKTRRSVISETVSSVTSTVISNDMLATESASPTPVDTSPIPASNNTSSDNNTKTSPNRLCGKQDCSIKVNHLHPKTSPIDKAKSRTLKDHAGKQCDKISTKDTTETTSNPLDKKNDNQKDDAISIEVTKYQTLEKSSTETSTDSTLQYKHDSIKSNIDKTVEPSLLSFKKTPLFTNSESSSSSSLSELDSSMSSSDTENMDTDSLCSMDSIADYENKTANLNKVTDSSHTNKKIVSLHDKVCNSKTNDLQTINLDQARKPVNIIDDNQYDSKIASESKDVHQNKEPLRSEKILNNPADVQSKNCIKQTFETSEKDIEKKGSLIIKEQNKENSSCKKRNSSECKTQSILTAPPDKSFLLQSLVLGVQTVIKEKQLDESFGIISKDKTKLSPKNDEHNEMISEVKIASDVELFGDPLSDTSDSFNDSSSDSGSFSDTSSDSFSCSCSDCSARNSSSSSSSSSSSTYSSSEGISSYSDEDEDDDNDEQQCEERKSKQNNHNIACENGDAVNKELPNQTENKENGLSKFLTDKELDNVKVLLNSKDKQSENETKVTNISNDKDQKLEISHTSRSYCAKEIPPCVLKLSKENSSSQSKDDTNINEGMCDHECSIEESPKKKSVQNIDSKINNRGKCNLIKSHVMDKKVTVNTKMNDTACNKTEGPKSEKISKTPLSVIQLDTCVADKQTLKRKKMITKPNSVLAKTVILTKNKEITEKSNNVKGNKSETKCGQSSSKKPMVNNKVTSVIESKIDNSCSEKKTLETEDKSVSKVKVLQDNFRISSVIEDSKQIPSSEKINDSCDIKVVQPPDGEPFEAGEICTYHLDSYKIPKLKSKQNSKQLHRKEKRLSPLDSHKLIRGKTYSRSNNENRQGLHTKNKKPSPFICKKTSPVGRKRKTVVSKPYISTSESDSDENIEEDKKSSSSDGHGDRSVRKDISFTNCEKSKESSVSRSHDNRKLDTNKVDAMSSKIKLQLQKNTKDRKADHKYEGNSKSKSNDKQNHEIDEDKIVKEDDLISPRSSILKYASKLVKEMIESKSEEDISSKAKLDKQLKKIVIPKTDTRKDNKNSGKTLINEISATEQQLKGSKIVSDNPENADSHTENNAGDELKLKIFGTKDTVCQENSNSVTNKSKENHLELDIHAEETLDFFDEFEDVSKGHKKLTDSKDSTVSSCGSSNSLSSSSEDGEISDDTDIETALIQYKQSPTKPDKLFQEKVKITERNRINNKLIFQQTSAKKFSPIKFLPSPNKNIGTTEDPALYRAKHALRRLSYKDLDSPGQFDEQTSRDSYSPTQFRRKIRDRDTKRCSRREHKYANDTMSGNDSRSSVIESRSDRKQRRRDRRRSKSRSPREARHRERQKSPVCKPSNYDKKRKLGKDRKNKVTDTSKRKRSSSRESSGDRRRNKNLNENHRKHKNRSLSPDSKQVKDNIHRKSSKTNSRSNKNETKYSDNCNRITEKKRHEKDQISSASKKSSAKKNEKTNKGSSSSLSKRKEILLTSSSSDTEQVRYRHQRQKRKHLQSSTDYETDCSFDQQRYGRSSKKVRKDAM